MPSIVYIVKFLSEYNAQNNINNADNCSKDNSDNSPKQLTSIKWFVVCMFNVVAFIIICTTGVVVAICK